MVKFSVLSAKLYDAMLKMRIQSTGRCGFGEDTAKMLALSEETYFKFAIDQEKPQDGLYTCILRHKDADAFQVKKSSKYFYLSTARMFDSLEIDYRNQNVILDMVRCTSLDAEMGGEVYKLNIRIRKKNNDDNNDNDGDDGETENI